MRSRAAAKALARRRARQPAERQHGANASPKTGTIRSAHGRQAVRRGAPPPRRGFVSLACVIAQDPARQGAPAPMTDQQRKIDAYIERQRAEGNPRYQQKSGQVSREHEQEQRAAAEALPWPRLRPAERIAKLRTWATRVACATSGTGARSPRSSDRRRSKRVERPAHDRVPRPHPSRANESRRTALGVDRPHRPSIDGDRVARSEDADDLREADRPAAAALGALAVSGSRRTLPRHVRQAAPLRRVRSVVPAKGPAAAIVCNGVRGSRAEAPAARRRTTHASSTREAGLHERRRLRARTSR